MSRVSVFEGRVKLVLLVWQKLCCEHGGDLSQQLRLNGAVGGSRREGIGCNGVATADVEDLTSEKIHFVVQYRRAVGDSSSA